jgi:D-alanine-D-alanine ligase
MSARILIVYNEPFLPAEDTEAEAEHAVLQTVSAVRDRLRDAGFEVESRPVGRDARTLAADVAAWPPQAIFNLFEGFGDDPASEGRVTRRLEALAIPLTGSPARALRLAGRKHLAMAALAAAGLPTPRSMLAGRASRKLCTLNWPVIAKPALFHGSVGIDQASVATTPWQLAARIDYLLGRYKGTVLVEEFIDGREFTVAVIQESRLVALPAMEFDFLGTSATRWPLVTYDAKWRPDSADYHQTPVRHAVPLRPALEAQLSRLACQSFRILGCRDYARVDFRLDRQGRPWILEVNANPDLSPAACLAGALTSAGRDYASFLVSLARAALARGLSAGLTTAHGAR